MAKVKTAVDLLIDDLKEWQPGRFVPEALDVLRNLPADKLQEFHDEIASFRCPVEGCPHGRTEVFHHPTVAEIELPGPDGKRHVYKRQIALKGQPDTFVYAGAYDDTKDRLQAAIAADDWSLVNKLASDLAKGAP